MGTRNYLIGSIKGLLLQHIPNAVIMDISHDIEPFNYNDAMYVFGNSYGHFPKNTWHLLLVNTYYKPQPDMMLAWHQGHYFATADNGLLPMVLGRMPQWAVRLPQPTHSNSLLSWIRQIASAMAAMEQGMGFQDIGEEATDVQEMAAPQPAIGPDYIEGQIIFIDRFENVVINIRQELFNQVCKGRAFSIELTLNERIMTIHDHYAQVREGDKVAFFNDAGYLEIAINKGNAAGLFGLHAIGHGTDVRLLNTKMFYERVRIIFRPTG